MKILRTLIQLTTTATLAASLLNAGNGAFAARLAGNSTGNAIDYSTDKSTKSRVAPKSSKNSRFGDYAQYEPDPNGNPKTNNGTGTR